jgi:hypothetical protein
MNINIPITGLELKGAYGRTTIYQDWLDGKDFKITNGPYCSIRDLENMALEFDILEFIGHDGLLVKRVILNKVLEALDTLEGEFTRDD